jgi:hypothetical protein
MMELDEGAKPNQGCSRQRYHVGFSFCIKDTIEGVDDIGYIAVL